MRNKLLFLILLIGIVGFTPSVTLAGEGNAVIENFKCTPTKAKVGDTINVQASLYNIGDNDYMWLYVAWNGTDSPNKDLEPFGEDLGGVSWNFICEDKGNLDTKVPGEPTMNKMSCDSSFTMPNDSEIFVRAWGFHDEGGWADYDNRKTITITLKEVPTCNNNGIKEAGEECDGADLDGETCVTQGYTGGTLSCKSDCTFDFSSCTGTPPPSPPNGVGGITFENPLVYDEFSDLVDGIVDFIFTIAIVIVPLAIVIGAFFLLISGGDTKKIKIGKDIILYSLIGLVIVLFAKGLISMIESILKVEIGG